MEGDAGVRPLHRARVSPNARYSEVCEWIPGSKCVPIACHSGYDSCVVGSARRDLLCPFASVRAKAVIVESQRQGEEHVRNKRRQGAISPEPQKENCKTKEKAGLAKGEIEIEAVEPQIASALFRIFLPETGGYLCNATQVPLTELTIGRKNSRLIFPQNGAVPDEAEKLLSLFGWICAGVCARSGSLCSVAQLNATS